MSTVRPETESQIFTGVFRGDRSFKTEPESDRRRPAADVSGDAIDAPRPRRFGTKPIYQTSGDYL